MLQLHKTTILNTVIRENRPRLGVKSDAVKRRKSVEIGSNAGNP